MKKWRVYILSALILFSLAGCSVSKEHKEKLRDVEFTVVNPQDVPEELSGLIEEKKAEGFQLTYADKGYLYLARGYGAQETSGYSVEVKECYESEDAVVMESELLGPPKDEEILEKETYPYVVVKTEYMEKDVVME